MSALARQNGPGLSMSSKSPVPPQPVLVKSPSGEMTTSSGGALALGEASAFVLRQLRRDPVSAVRALDAGIAALGATQRSPVEGARLHPGHQVLASSSFMKLRFGLCAARTEAR